MGRIDRINQLVKREIGVIIQQELQDPRFQFVSVTQVKVSPDLQNAWIGFSFLGEKSQAQDVQKALRHAAGLIRRLVSQRIDLKHTPRLEFVYDPSLDYSAEVGAILEEIKREIPFDRRDTDTEEAL